MKNFKTMQEEIGKEISKNKNKFKLATLNARLYQVQIDRIMVEEVIDKFDFERLSPQEIRFLIKQELGISEKYG